MQVAEQPYQRKHSRESVKWIARIGLDNGLVTGTVRDWSPGGVCFEPEVGYIDGAFEAGSGVLSEFDRGDSISLVMICDSGKAQSATVGVRWLGYSQAHGCAAMGLEFTGGGRNG